MFKLITTLVDTNVDAAYPGRFSYCVFALSHGDSFFVTASFDGINVAVFVWDLQLGSLVESYRVLRNDRDCGTAAIHVSINHDNRTAIVRYTDGMVHLLCLETGDFIRSYDLHQPVHSGAVALSQDGSLAFNVRNSIQHWTVSECFPPTHPPTHTHTRTFYGHEDDVFSFVYTSPTQMVSGSSDEMRVWDVTSGACTQVLSDQNGLVWGLSLSADVSVLVSASEDGTLKRWGLRHGGSEWECTLTLTGHTSGVLCVAVSLGGDLAVSGSWDHSIRVWDMKTGTCTKVLEGHTVPVEVVALSGDCKTAITGGATTR